MSEYVFISLDDWYTFFALEILLKDNESFLTVKETLTRIGVMGKKDKKLYQSCHIYFKRGKYYIVHFKELFALDGRSVNITKEDIGRRNTIASLLDEWNMVKIKNPEIIDGNKMSVSGVKVLKFADKDKYTLVPKYQIGSV